MNTALIQVVIDGKRHRFPAGMTVLQALRSLGIEPRTLCHDDRLAPIGQCWSCSVEISPAQGVPFHNRPACREPLRDGCEVRSQSNRLETFRRTLLLELNAQRKMQ